MRDIIEYLMQKGDTLLAYLDSNIPAYVHILSTLSLRHSEGTGGHYVGAIFSSDESLLTIKRTNKIISYGIVKNGLGRAAKRRTRTKKKKIIVASIGHSNCHVVS